MRSKFFIFLFCLIFLLLTSTAVSATRLPVIGGDEDTWGTVLNEFLNVSLNETGQIRSVNLTLGQKITFALGEVIDNLVSNWIRIDANLNVTGNITIQGSSLTVGGNEVCLADGTNCQSSTTTSLGFFVNYTFNKTTGNITNGTLNGYLAGNAICNVEIPGTHMCQIHEVLNWINANKSLDNFTATFRVSEGAPGFTANANDCDGWKSADGSSLGSVWVGDTSNGGSGSLVACNAARAIGCCL